MLTAVVELHAAVVDLQAVVIWVCSILGAQHCGSAGLDGYDVVHLPALGGLACVTVGDEHLVENI